MTVEGESEGGETIKSAFQRIFFSFLEMDVNIMNQNRAEVETVPSNFL